MINRKPKNVRQFGVVQGRLSVAPVGQLQWFPQDCWQAEFEVAKALGIQFIELLTERTFNPNNPFWTQTGRAEIKLISEKTGCFLYSSCADYIIDHSLLNDPKDQTKKHVTSFLSASADLGCKVVVFPLLEQSDLNTSTASSMVAIIRDFARQAAKTNTMICIESLMTAGHLRTFLEKINEPNVKCVFDTGNRVVDSLDLASEIRLLRDWIAHVHIKDKNALRDNVLLGTGCVNFEEVFEALHQIDYDGPLVFETTRGKSPAETAIFNMTTCNFFSQEVYRG